MAGGRAAWWTDAVPDQPRLLGPTSGGPLARVALVLQGGRVRSQMSSRGHQLASVRMLSFARAIRQAGVPAYRLRYRVRGWNADGGATPDPVGDARWALAEVRHRHGAAARVLLIGHSMGARTALWVAGDEQVTGVVALAPWCEAGDPVAQLAGRDVLIAHGTRDRITSPAASLAYARRAVAAGARVRRVEVDGETHAMLRRPRVWDRLVTDFVRLPRALPNQSAAPADPNPSGGPLHAAHVNLRDPLREVV